MAHYNVGDDERKAESAVNKFLEYNLLSDDIEREVRALLSHNEPFCALETIIADRKNQRIQKYRDD